jgi:hypothetical protein
MLRRLYRSAVRLHPTSFRRRFGDEMLYIFDQQRGTLARLRVMLDCVFSLLRQWTLRPHVSIETPAAPVRSPTADHIPSFETLDPPRPRVSAIIHGTLLSLVLFYTTVFGIRYSWIHVLHLHIPEVAADSSTQLLLDSKKSPQQLQVDVIPTEANQADDAQSKTIASASARTSVAPIRPPRAMIWLDQYVGEYVSNHPPARIWIQIAGDHLSLAAVGQRSTLSPTSRTRFVIVGGENSYVDFTSDARGEICCLSLVANGKVITAQRQ